MKINPFILIVALLPALSFANNTFEPKTGQLNISTVSVGEHVYQVGMQNTGSLLFNVTNINELTIPKNFTAQWLNQKTLYWVWFGDGFDDNNQPMHNVPIVSKVFYDNGTAHTTGLLNSNDLVSLYKVDENNGLSHGENEDLGIDQICERLNTSFISDFSIPTASPKYRSVTNTSAVYFSEAEALNAARLINNKITSCKDDIMINPEKPISTDEISVRFFVAGCINTKTETQQGNTFTFAFDFSNACFTVPPGGFQDWELGRLTAGKYTINIVYSFEGGNSGIKKTKTFTVSQGQ